MGRRMGHAAERVPALSQARAPLDPERQVGARTDGDRQPEVEQAPGDHAQPGDAGGDAEADERVAATASTMPRPPGVSGTAASTFATP